MFWALILGAFSRAQTVPLLGSFRVTRQAMTEDVTVPEHLAYKSLGYCLLPESLCSKQVIFSKPLQLIASQTLQTRLNRTCFVANSCNISVNSPPVA